MESKSTWSAKPINKEKTTIEETSFIYDQAEKNLKENVAAGDLVVSRCTTLISLIIGIIIALVGYSTNRYDHLKSFDKFSLTSLIGIIYLFFCLIYISKNLKGTKYSVIGAAPKTLFSDDFFIKEIDSKIRTNKFIWAQIENYQDSIGKAKVTNEIRWKRFNKCVNLLIFSPLLLITTFILTILFE